MKQIKWSLLATAVLASLVFSVTIQQQNVAAFNEKNNEGVSNSHNHLQLLSVGDGRQFRKLIANAFVIARNTHKINSRSIVFFPLSFLIANLMMEIKKKCEQLRLVSRYLLALIFEVTLFFFYTSFV
jgi:uncharacterized membrane protein YciS (DUF1049 family)